MFKRLTIILVVVLLLLSCAPFQQAATSLSLLAATAKAGIGLTSETATPAPTLAPSATPTLGPLSQPVPMTKGENFEVWDLLLGQPEHTGSNLVVEQDGAFALDPQWPVNRIEFVYKWWGDGDPIMDYQYLWKSNQNYLNNSGKAISSDLVKGFMASLSNLQAEPNLLASLSHKDDYHAWYVELTGEDGQTILLQSTSNTSKIGTPWNLIYDGRVYAQLDGSLFPELQKVFPHQPYKPKYPFAESNTAGFVPFSVSRIGSLIEPDFTGLMPLRGDMTYIAGVGNEGITLVIRKEGLNGFIEDIVPGTIATIQKVELTDPEGKKVRCGVGENRISWLGTGWNVNCPVTQLEGEETFSFPIEVSFRTVDGRGLTTKGVLHSYWGFADLDQAEVLPEWMADEFARHPLASQLWEDHVLYDLTYLGSIKSTDPTRGTLYGEATLFGESHLDGKPFRYTISTLFGFENGKLTRWDVTREDVEQSLASITQLASNQLIFNTTGDVTLNLYIARKGSTPRLPSLIDFDAAKYEVHTQACASNPKLDVPTRDVPFIGFAWNGAWRFSNSSSQLFVLSGGQAIPVNNIFYSNERDPAILAIRPVTLNDPRFQGAYMLGVTTPDYGKSEVFVWLNENTSTRGRNSLRDMLEEAFGSASLDRSDDYYWVVKLTTLVFNTDGTLEFARCQQATE